MTYAEAIDWLFNLNRFGMKLGLENIRVLAEALGRPQDRFHAVLVAGTNGKGSTAAMLHAILLAAGIRAALYTSPHLVRAEERIRLGEREIDAAQLTAILGQIRALIEKLLQSGRLQAHPTFFEVTTAAALIACARAEIEIAVLEVGLGGRLDATNVVDPILSVITSIDFDHREQLGPTLASIAREKAGILRDGVAGLLGDLDPEPLAAVREEAAKVGARVVLAREGSETASLPSSDPLAPPRWTVKTPVRSYANIGAPLAGAHQLRNALLAVRAAELLDAPRRAIGERAIVAGLARTRWPGRLERIEGRPSLLLDGAHNPAGAKVLAAHIASLPAKPVLLFAAMRDKEARAMLEILLPRVSSAVFTKPAIERAEDPAELLAAARSVSAASVEGGGAPDYHENGDAAAALEIARRLARPEGLVLVSGSLYLVGAVKAILEGGAPRPGESP